MSELELTDGDVLLSRLKKSREVNAVQKVEFASFASRIPDDTLIFSFEGPDDRNIYYAWIGQICSSLKYEAYQCNGKRQVLQLFDVLSGDQTGLGQRVYYFVDQDFDGLQGRPHSERIFVTDRYSVESYLLCEYLLDNLLNVSFHCNGLVDLRAHVVRSFFTVYDEFLNVTRDINFRIFVSRLYKIETGELPSSLHNFVKINLEGIEQIGASATDFIALGREPTDAEVASATELFNSLNPRIHYRGKFALFFFSRWLGLLRSDRMSENPKLFSAVPVPANAIHGDFSFQYLAGKARAPDHLPLFLKSVCNSFCPSAPAAISV